jgi:tetratricopeptide (TPR) repeat protein
VNPHENGPFFTKDWQIFFSSERDTLNLNVDDGRRNSTWQSYELQFRYHQLCKSPQASLPNMLNHFLNALKANIEFAEHWAMTMQQAGQDCGDDNVSKWGTNLFTGLKAYQEGNYRETINMFNNILEYPQLELHPRAIAHGWRGQIYWVLREYEKSIQDLNKSIDQKPRFAWALAYRGDSKRRLRKIDDAIIDFNRAIDLDPDFLWTRVNRARAYSDINDFDKALEDLNYVIELEPDNHWAIAYRGLTFGKMHLFKQALVDFFHAIELREAYGWVIAQIGFTYRLIGEHQKAISFTSQAIELEPNLAWLYVSRGLSHLLQANHEIAFNDFDTGVKLRKHERNTNYYRGFIYRGMAHRLYNRYDESLADLDIAIEHMPSSYTAYYQRGLTQQCLQNNQQAHDDFEEALNLVKKKADEKLPAWWRRIEYARCLLAAGEVDNAMETYQKFLTDGIPASTVSEELFYLNDFFQIYPQHDTAKKIVEKLQAYFGTV